MAEPRVFALSVHADYACRHSGACCRAGWAIPVERRIRPLLGTDLLTPNADGACQHFDGSSRLCRIHHEHGADMLPAACHHFPRLALHDARGLFVNLTHFCPTAAEQLLRADVRLAIVQEPPAFPASRSYDPLDGRETWPPLVSSRLLFDLESYGVWEQFVVDTLALDGPVSDALITLATVAERLREWTPTAGSLLEWTHQICAPATARESCEPRSPRESTTGSGAPPHQAWTLYEPFAQLRAYEAVVRTVPEGLPRPSSPPGLEQTLATFVNPYWDAWSVAVRRYAAAKAFAWWGAYQARGIRTLVAELVTACTVLEIEAARACHAAHRPLDRALMLSAIRNADWLLVHLADRAALTHWLDRVE